MIIKPLDQETLKAAILLKIIAWTEELQGKMENTLDFNQEYDFWLNWMASEQQHNDKRTLLGAFDGDRLMGAIFASFAELEDHHNAVEINGLWVYQEDRGKKISYYLMNAVTTLYLSYGNEACIVYNHHYSKSNTYYKKLGGTVMREDLQEHGQLVVDVFSFDLQKLDRLIQEKLHKT